MLGLFLEHFSSSSRVTNSIVTSDDSLGCYRRIWKSSNQENQDVCFCGIKSNLRTSQASLQQTLQLTRKGFITSLDVTPGQTGGHEGGER